MTKVILDAKAVQAEAFSARRCIFELNDKKVNPYQLIERREYAECNRALEKLVPAMHVRLGGYSGNDREYSGNHECAERILQGYVTDKA